MPQIGWFEILVIVILAILIIGPKDFPVVLKKIGGWLSSIKKYFNEIQSSLPDMENIVEEESPLEKKHSNQTKHNEKDE